MQDLETIRHLFYSSVDYLGENGSGFNVGHENNCHWSISGLQNPFSNRLAIYNDDVEIFEQALLPFYEANLPHYVKLGGAGLVHAKALIAKGYVNEGASPMMIRALNPEQDKHTLRSGLTAKLIESREELHLCQEILSDGFNRPRGPDQEYDDPFPESLTSFRYLLFDEDRPVATTQLIRTGDFLSCYATATRPSEQKKGYGRELMRWALATHAAQGDRTVVLQSSNPGIPLYKSIGFEVLEYFQNWQMNTTERMRRFTHHELKLGEFDLRPLRKEDIEWAISAFNDEAFAQWMGFPFPYGEKDFEATLQRRDRFQLDGYGINWVIERDGTPQGMIACHHTDWKYKRTEIGYGAFASSRGTGVIPTVLRHLVEFLFAEYGFERIEVRTDVNNQSSRRAAEKAGFTLEGELRRNFLNLGEVTDDAIFSVIPDDLSKGDLTR